MSGKLLLNFPSRASNSIFSMI